MTWTNVDSRLLTSIPLQYRRKYKRYVGRNYLLKWKCLKMLMHLPGDNELTPIILNWNLIPPIVLNVPLTAPVNHYRLLKFNIHFISHESWRLSIDSRSPIFHIYFVFFLSFFFFFFFFISLYNELKHVTSVTEGNTYISLAIWYVEVWVSGSLKEPVCGLCLPRAAITLSYWRIPAPDGQHKKLHGACYGPPIATENFPGMGIPIIKIRQL